MDPKLAKVIEAARAGVEQDPRSAAAWGRLGLILRAHDYGAEANTCFAEAEKLDPTDPRWPYHRSQMLLISDPDAGIACLRRACDLGGTVTSPTLTLAEVLVSKGQMDEAAELYHRVLKTDGGSARAHYGLGRIAYSRGDTAAALHHLTLSAQHLPGIQSTHSLLAEVHYARGERERAEEQQAIANQLGPTTAWPDPYMTEVARLRVGIDARLSQAAELLQQNQIPEATELLNQAAGEYPDSFDVWLALGKANLRRRPGDYAAAERAFREAVRLAPDDPAAHFHLGIALEQQKQFQKAAASYAEAVALKPDYAFAHYNRGQCLLQTGDRISARDAFATAARVKPNFVEAHRELGDLLGQTGQLDEALRHLEQAAKLAPKDAKTKQLLDDLRKKLPAPK
jgi:tetratricopeptide (TPR) repeat protein